jgi:Antitoxin MazE-like
MVAPLSTRVAGLRSHRRGNGLRPVVLWLPDTSRPAYRARIAAQCRQLADLTADERAMAEAFEREVAQTPGWR